jgi:hypothetical protein
VLERSSEQCWRGSSQPRRRRQRLQVEDKPLLRHAEALGGSALRNHRDRPQPDRSGDFTQRRKEDAKNAKKCRLSFPFSSILICLYCVSTSLRETLIFLSHLLPDEFSSVYFASPRLPVASLRETPNAFGSDQPIALATGRVGQRSATRRDHPRRTVQGISRKDAKRTQSTQISNNHHTFSNLL